MTKPKPKPAPSILPEKDWPIAKIVPHPNNERTHPPAEIALLAQLLKRWGPDQAIVVDERGVILKGHARRLAALEAGLETFPVKQRMGLPETEKTAMRISDNQVAALAGWDNAKVQLAIGNLRLAGYPVELLGFGDAQLVQFTTTPGPPAEFAQFDENVPTAHECPNCHYRWSGSSAPAKVEPEKPGKPAKEKKPKP